MHSRIPLDFHSNCFHLATNDQVEVVALSSYEEKEDQFKEQVWIVH